MDSTVEAVVRAALHDLSNTFAGIQGVLDLSDPAQPLPTRQRQRLDGLLADGFTLLQRTRHLTLGTRPESMVESGTAWRGAIEVQAQPLAAAFHCEIQISYQGDPVHDRWPGELARSWVLAVTRQVLPYFRATPERKGLLIDTEADAQEWRLVWHPAKGLPECLKPSEEHPRDISACWAKEIGRSLGAEMSFHHDRIVARIPRF